VITRLPRRSPGWTGLKLDQLDAERERPYWIALSQVPGLGPAAFVRLLATAGTLRAAWGEGAVDLAIAELPPETAPAAAETVRAIRGRGVRRAAADLIAQARRHGALAITALDPLYPPSLAHLDPRPPVLWASGDHAAWQTPGVAVVGTRRPSGYGRAAAEEIGDELARAGVVVISGLAVGVDAVAHAAAVAAGGRSTAVLPSPIDRIYPPIHRELANRMLAAKGALLTELPPGRRLGRPDFARRNRIIAGLAEAVVVVEAPDRSGALLTADAAIALGRELFAVPGPMDAATSRGTNRLIADHLATLVTSPPALLHMVGLRRGRMPVSVRSLSEAEGLVLAAVLRRSASIEELVDGTQLSTSALAATLTMLEARGLVTAYAGATFHPTLAARRSGWGRRPGDKAHQSVDGVGLYSRDPTTPGPSERRTRRSAGAIVY
jgi:DNA processing protein